MIAAPTKKCPGCGQDHAADDEEDLNDRPFLDRPEKDEQPEQEGAGANEGQSNAGNAIPPFEINVHPHATNADEKGYDSNPNSARGANNGNQHTERNGNLIGADRAMLEKGTSATEVTNGASTVNSSMTDVLKSPPAHGGGEKHPHQHQLSLATAIAASPHRWASVSSSHSSSRDNRNAPGINFHKLSLGTAVVPDSPNIVGNSLPETTLLTLQRSIMNFKVDVFAWEFVYNLLFPLSLPLVLMNEGVKGARNRGFWCASKQRA